MIAFWNRREVFMGFDLGQLARVRNVLSAAGVDYVYRSVGRNMMGARRARVGSLGEGMTFSAMYYVYVHKDDVDRARAELQKSDHIY